MNGKRITLSDGSEWIYGPVLGRLPWGRWVDDEIIYRAPDPDLKIDPLTAEDHRKIADAMDPQRPAPALLAAVFLP